MFRVARCSAAPFVSFRSCCTSPVQHLNALLPEEQMEAVCQVHKAKKGDHYQSALPFNRCLTKGSDPIEVANNLIK